MTSKKIVRNYMLLIVLNTLSASFIWGVNTLFLLDAGLNNFEAFIVNAAFTLGIVLFEIPTGVVADTVGRRASYLLGCATLFISTVLSLILWKMQAHVFLWVLVSIFVGLGFTFFSGALEAWLVDALGHVGFKGKLEDIFSRGQIAHGAAMLSGTVLGGYAAEIGDLGTPFVLRVFALLLSFIFAGWVMKDLGFETRPLKNVNQEMKRIFKASIDNGIKVPHIRWMMLTAPFLMGSGMYVFYASQPYLLELYGDKEAYGIAGLAAALFASSQIVGGLAVPYVRRFFVKRSQLILTLLTVALIALFALSFAGNFWIALMAMFVWSQAYSITTPVKQAYMNSCIPSQQRATILSFEGLMGSTGGTVFQPVLGKAADVWSYPISITIAGCIQFWALPFVWLAGRENHPSDALDTE